LRPARDHVLGEVRWRYRECMHLAGMMAQPPEDPKLALFWRLRLEEYASYLEVLSGREVVSLGPMEEPR
jgi:hypothetical protein